MTSKSEVIWIFNYHPAWNKRHVYSLRGDDLKALLAQHNKLNREEAPRIIREVQAKWTHGGLNYQVTLPHEGVVWEDEENTRVRLLTELSIEASRANPELHCPTCTCRAETFFEERPALGVIPVWTSTATVTGRISSRESNRSAKPSHAVEPEDMTPGPSSPGKTPHVLTYVGQDYQKNNDFLSVSLKWIADAGFAPSLLANYYVFRWVSAGFSQPGFLCAEIAPVHVVLVGAPVITLYFEQNADIGPVEAYEWWYPNLALINRCTALVKDAVAGQEKALGEVLKHFPKFGAEKKTEPQAAVAAVQGESNEQ